MATSRARETAAQAETPTVLQAVGWDHERCMAPMHSATQAWRRLQRRIDITWSTRSLAAFNDEPLDELAKQFDLIVIDHPFVGTAHATGCLLPLDQLLHPGALEALARNAIGPSHDSYTYAGRQWALAVDSACQVSAARPDLLARTGRRPPATWAEVLELARAVPGRVGLPLYPTDAVCALLTLAANAGQPAPAGASFFASTDVGERLLSFLGALVPLLHEDSFELNPPSVLDRMRDTDEIEYVPLVFGYLGYARSDGPGRAVRFLDIPSAGNGPAGALLGGAGIAISSRCRAPLAAASFAAWVCGADAQASIVLPAGGQPASRSAWFDPTASEASGGFFVDTVATMTRAFVRPRAPWWPEFQEEAGELVASRLRHRTLASRIVAELEDLYRLHAPAENVMNGRRPD